jgi:D-alanine-D-alanine ligase
VDFQTQLVFIDPKGRWLSMETAQLTGKIDADGKSLTGGSRELQAAERLAPNGAAPDVVFPVLHGPMGEDGTVQGLLELAGLPYVGCGVLGSAAGMDKEISKRLASQAGLPILPYAVLHDPKLAPAAARMVGFPLFVKPARLGSSVGISKVKNARQLPKAIKEAFLYDDKVILEKGLSAREIEIGVFGDPWSRDPKDPLRLQASVVGEIVPNAEFYTYESKYLDSDGATLKIPADIPPQASKKIKEFALLAFRALDCYGMARADFLMDKKTGAVYFNELNTIPGFTPASMYPLLWKAAGMDTPELLAGLIQLALRRHKTRSKLKTAP